MRKDFKDTTFKILNGVSTSVVIALVPGALINELMKGISGVWSGAQNILTMAAAALLAVAPVAAGVMPGAASVNTVQAADTKGNDFVLQPTGKPEFSADATTVFSVDNKQYGNGAVLP